MSLTAPFSSKKDGSLESVGLTTKDDGFVGEGCEEREGRRKTVMRIGILGLCG